MSKPIIAIYALIKEKQVKEIQAIAKDYDVLLADEIESNHIEHIEIIFGWKKELYDYYRQNKLKNLKWIQKETAGLDAIPQKLRNNEQIMLSNMKGIHAVPITENVFGYMFSVAKGILTAIEKQKHKEWDRTILEQVFSLRNKTLMIYGTGTIGQEIARTAKFFNMTTIGVNTTGSARKYFDQTYTIQASSEHLKQARFVINALPHTQASDELFNDVLFNQMAREAYFINIGRGGSVVEVDLIEALENEAIAGAYIDVAKEEPLPVESALWEAPNLVITPHISGTIEHFRDAIYPIFKENLQSYLTDGKLSMNVYNRQKGY